MQLMNIILTRYQVLSLFVVLHGKEALERCPSGCISHTKMVCFNIRIFCVVAEVSEVHSDVTHLIPREGHIAFEILDLKDKGYLFHLPVDFLGKIIGASSWILQHEEIRDAVVDKPQIEAP